jgi:hypothetical protein
MAITAQPMGSHSPRLTTDYALLALRRGPVATCHLGTALVPFALLEPYYQKEAYPMSSNRTWSQRLADRRIAISKALPD